MDRKEILTCEELVERWEINKITLARWLYIGQISCCSISNFKWCDAHLSFTFTCGQCGEDRLLGYLGSEYFLKSKNPNWNLEYIMKNMEDLFFFHCEVLEYEREFQLTVKSKNGPTSLDGQKGGSPEKIISGYNEIGKFLGRDSDTVKKTYKKQGIPIYRDERSRRVWAVPSELVSWMEKRSAKKQS